ncbi:hypothetical protein SEA_DUSTYDINO_70 [Microbacterium phage DustyDino]|nr:hypothetical protein SEA_DUSTYDINO_70 [Microbacterium phage DustyDino]WMI33938.1 hypothetical protein SEA_ERENYEAGER_67 [Microbacterium phage Erenyeager]
MSADPRIHLWPKLEKDDPRVLKVKEVVIGLNLGYSVKPFWYQPGVSEGVERVVVLADGFEHGTVVDYIHPKKPAMVQEAVEWALGVREESRGAHSWIDKMQSIFGEDLRETTEERWEEIAGNYA